MTMTGIIKKIVSDKGYGFIKTDETDYFFHYTALVDVKFDDLREGMKVSFDSDTKNGKVRAKDVRVIE